MSSIDYASLVDDQGRLVVSQLPRPVYTRYVNEYRKQPEVIREIFSAFYFEFDLDQKLDEAAAAGRQLSTAEAAEQVLGEMEDGDWWRVMEAFEDHAIRHFSDDPERWSFIIEETDRQ